MVDVNKDRLGEGGMAAMRLVEGGVAALGDGRLVEGPDGASLVFSSCTNSAALDSRRASDSTPLRSRTIIKNGSLRPSVCFCLPVFRVQARGSQL